jgi:N12 class adenine-specific DNA methylase
MPRFISISKAALLAHVQAKEIQEKINNNQLSSTRGKIHVDDFLECYPHARIDEVDMLLLVEKIKEKSFEDGAAKQHGEVTIASLKQDLKKSKTNEEYFREQSRKYEELILQICENLNDTEDRRTNEQRIQTLKKWIDKRLSEIQRNE